MKKVIKKLREHLINYLRLKQKYDMINEVERKIIVKTLNEQTLNEEKEINKLIKLSLQSLKEMGSIKFKSLILKKFLKEELELPLNLKEELLKNFPYPKIINKLGIGSNRPLTDEDIKTLKIEAKSCSKIINDMYRKGINDPKKQPSEILKSIKKAFSLQDRNKENKLYKEPRFIKPSKKEFESEVEDTFVVEKELEEVIKETITSANIIPPTFKEEDKKTLVKTETKPILKKKKKSKNLLTKKKI